jgi:Cu/Ag efflux pump CusA
LAIGAALLLVALVALLLEWRIALISLVSITLSLVAAALVLDLRGETINALVLAGLVLALAVVVDDALAGVENTWRRLREQRGERNEDSTSAVILEASVEARSPLAYATLILLLALVPVFFFEGPVGAFFEPLAVSFALAVLASMLVALTVTPALSMLLLRNAPLDRRDPPLVRLLNRGYGQLTSRIERRPRLVLLGAALVVLVAAAVLPKLDYSVVPKFKEAELLAHFDGAPGTSRAEMVRITNRAGRELREIPGVRSVGAHVGRAVLSDHVSGVNSGELWVSIDPDADYDETVEAVREVVEGYPGIDRELLTYSEERIRAVGAVADGNLNRDNRGFDALIGTDEPVAIRIYGKDLEILREKADEVRDAVASVEGIEDPRVDGQPVEPTVEVEVDLEAAGRVGIKPGDVRRAAATLVQGIEVGALFEEQKVFDVLVTGVPEVRHSVSSIRELLIESPNGDRVPLGEVAEVHIAPTPIAIEREAASRYIDVVADIRGRDLDSVLGDVERRLEEIAFPLEYRAEVLAESSERQEAGRRILAFVIAAIIGIFLVLQAAFMSWRLALVFLLTMPLALAGGVVAAVIAGTTITLGSLVGFFAVFAIAARHSAQLVSHYRELEREAGETLDREQVLGGARDRLIPSVLTACALGLALLPLVVLGGAPGREIVHPMAVVVLGGLVTSTAFSLLAAPALYLRFAPRAKAERIVAIEQPAAGS